MTLRPRCPQRENAASEGERCGVAFSHRPFLPSFQSERLCLRLRTPFAFGTDHPETAKELVTVGLAGPGHSRRSFVPLSCVCVRYCGTRSCDPFCKRGVLLSFRIHYDSKHTRARTRTLARSTQCAHERHKKRIRGNKEQKRERKEINVCGIVACTTKNRRKQTKTNVRQDHRRQHEICAPQSLRGSLL